MPSTLVHVAIGGVVAAALLGREFDRRSVAVVLGVTAFPDLDTFVGLYVQGAHRAAFHTLVISLVVGGVLLYDTHVRPESSVRARWNDRGVRVAWVALAALVVGGICPDLMTNGVNAFYPLHDQFYTVDGKLLLSNHRGLVQTFVDLTPQRPKRTTHNTHYWTGVDPTAGKDPASAERIFPVVRSGLQLLIVLLGGFTLGGRFWDERHR
ncbi:MAG: metal-dependent hydrolase [Haloplanus sp.]